MKTIRDSSRDEFFILGDDWSLYEELVPRENFIEVEIRAKHSRRYWSADERSIAACPANIARRNIACAELAAYFGPVLRWTDRVRTCEFINQPDFLVPNGFALIPPK